MEIIIYGLVGYAIVEIIAAVLLFLDTPSTPKSTGSTRPVSSNKNTSRRIEEEMDWILAEDARRRREQQQQQMQQQMQLQQQQMEQQMQQAAMDTMSMGTFGFM